LVANSLTSLDYWFCQKCFNAEVRAVRLITDEDLKMLLQGKSINNTFIFNPIQLNTQFVKDIESVIRSTELDIELPCPYCT